MVTALRQRMTAAQKIRAAKLYAVTCPSPAGENYADMVRKAISGGADVIQLRDKNLSGRQLLEISRELTRICRAQDALFILNDRLDIAIAAGADGVHLGQDDMPLPEAREILKDLGLSQFLIGASTHSLEQALKAESEDADYLGCGPVFATPTKPDYQAQGLELVRQYRANIRIPFVAIGGIDASNIEQVKEAGANCIAVVRAVFAQDDIESAARSLKQKIS